MSVASNCSGCCVCPTPQIYYDSVSVSDALRGYTVCFTGGFDQISPYDVDCEDENYCPDLYGTYTTVTELGAGLNVVTFTLSRATPLSSQVTTEQTIVNLASTSGPSCASELPIILDYAASSVIRLRDFENGEGCQFDDNLTCEYNEVDFVNWSLVSSPTGTLSVSSYGTETGFRDCPYDADEFIQTKTLSNKFTDINVRDALLGVLPAFDDDFNDARGSYFISDICGRAGTIRACRYQFLFGAGESPVNYGGGKCYRLSWVERTLPTDGDGVSIDSIELISGGCYRPAVTIAAPPSGGVQARAVAVMTTDGRVASIRVLNPGAGYTTAPSVTIPSSTGASSATGWTATIADGMVTAIAGGTGGDYLPTVSVTNNFGYPDETPAEITLTMDAQGGIATATLNEGGAGYMGDNPTVTITARSAITAPARIIIHCGVEIPFCVSGTSFVPSLNPPFPEQWRAIPVPTVSGALSMVDNIVASCDCETCA